MQWTIDQIVAELGHLDVQMLSYIERAEMQPGEIGRKLKKLRKYIKANTDLIATLMYEMGDNYPSLHAEIVNEQQEWPTAKRSPADIRVTLPRDGRN